MAILAPDNRTCWARSQHSAAAGLLWQQLCNFYQHVGKIIAKENGWGPQTDSSLREALAKAGLKVN